MAGAAGKPDKLDTGRAAQLRRDIAHLVDLLDLDRDQLAGVQRGLAFPGHIVALAERLSRPEPDHDGGGADLAQRAGARCCAFDGGMPVHVDRIALRLQPPRDQFGGFPVH